jgi:pyruvate dehydrogenase E2 component (dihydrolipoamide acetyltransferase)
VLAAELRPLVERARAGRLRAEEVEGGSFTVSNLGMFGVEQFDAIINPPQGAILAVGAVRRQAVERDGAIAFASLISLSLSCDHRAIDGALGGRFLAALRELIESPQRL